MAFRADEFTPMRAFRTLTDLDLFQHAQCFNIALGRELTGQNVVAILERLRFDRGLRQRSDGGDTAKSQQARCISTCRAM